MKTAKNRDDIYLMETVTGREWKLSHHNEWTHWQLAQTSEAADKLAPIESC